MSTHLSVKPDLGQHSVKLLATLSRHGLSTYLKSYDFYTTSGTVFRWSDRCGGGGAALQCPTELCLGTIYDMSHLSLLLVLLLNLQGSSL
jgi:hypothetical protein